MGKVRFGAPSFGGPCKNDFGHETGFESEVMAVKNHQLKSRDLKARTPFGNNPLDPVQIKSSGTHFDSFCNFITACIWRLGEVLWSVSGALLTGETHFSDLEVKEKLRNELTTKVISDLDTEGQTVARPIFAKIFNQLNMTQLCALEGLMNQYENVSRFLLEVDRTLEKPRDVLKIAKKMADHPEKVEYIFQKYKPTAYLKCDLQDLYACFNDRQFFDDKLFATYVDLNLSAASK